MKPNLRLFIPLVAVTTVALHAVALGQDASRAAPFDRDGTPGLSDAERLIAAQHAYSPTLRKFDTDRDGVPDTGPVFPGDLASPELGIEPARREQLAKAQNKAIADREIKAAAYDIQFMKAQMDHRAAGQRELAVAVADQELRNSPLPLVPSVDSASEATQRVAGFLTKVRVRAQPEEIGIDSKLAKPAKFSYSHDFEGDAELWLLRGVLGLAPEPLFDEAHRDAESPPARPEPATEFVWAPLIQFDRTTNSGDSSKETNLLAAKAMFVGTLELIAPEPMRNGRITNRGRWLYGRGSPFWATDFDFESSVAGTDFAIGIIAPDAGMGVARNVGNLPISFRLQPELLAEYKHVFDDGGKAALQNSVDSMRLGAGITLAMRPTHREWSDRLLLTLSYRHTSDANNDWDGNDLFDAALSYDLDAAGHFQATITYRNGDIPITEEKVNQLSFGLGVKF